MMEPCNNPIYLTGIEMLVLVSHVEMI
jgi:hypothetical protein